MMTLQSAVEAVSGEQQNVLYLRALVEKEHPIVMKALQLIDEDRKTIKRAKGYNLLKVANKKRGFVYYVRYWHDGAMLPSKWCTHTNNYEDACEFALSNREALIAQYLGRARGEVVRFFEKFFEEDNPVFQNECKRNNEMSEANRKRFHSIITKKFVPFLLERKIRSYDAIDVPLLDDFQDVLLSKGLISKSVNTEMLPVGRVLKYLARKGMIKTNPYMSLAPVPSKAGETKTHGCYELDKLQGIFGKKWADHKSFLLNLIAYTTNMRNSEIRTFSKNDILLIDGCRFIDLKESKTPNGIRQVPLHDTVYRYIMDYADKTDAATPVFGSTSKDYFSKAARELGKMMGVTEEFLTEQNITFYSGRHAWKTMMSTGGLGEDAEEIFMGHKVSSNVAKLYNHRDKQGQDRIVKKAKEVFAILDSMLFTPPKKD